jgi:hypothetical protein
MTDLPVKVEIEGEEPVMLFIKVPNKLESDETQTSKDLQRLIEYAKIKNTIREALGIRPFPDL